MAMLMAQATTVLTSVVKSSLQRVVLDLAKLTWATATAVEMSLLAATPVRSSGDAAGLVGSGGFGVALP